MTLVDTGPLVALCDPRDGRHRAARRELKRLAAGGLRTCEAVVVEACFHLDRPAQRRRLDEVLEGLAIECLPTHDREFQSAVFAWLVKYADHTPDWADGCLALLTDGDPRLRLWTYDREFRTTWRRRDGRVIPLALK